MSHSGNWVFLRGLMRESRHWGDFPAVFRRHVDAADVHVPDLPGNGRLHMQDSPMRVSGMVECYRRALAAQSAPPPYHLLALSLGAMTAVEWAHRYPQEVRSCVLINTSMRPFSPFYRRLHWRVYPEVLRLAMAHADAQARERLVLELTSRGAAAVDATLAAWTAYQNEYPVSRSNALRQLLAAARYHAPAQRPPMPMLVLTSAADRLVDPACSRRLADAWKTALFVHPDAGHDLPLDDGPWVARRIATWLDAGQDSGRLATQQTI
ncbi:MAG TPA: alpha/beta hydrolase [Noviherbaspirillum sp.]|uniref:alpha/beta fold hydrolase n=1 Tax=Noviherbaspirillum sp. TaxID=1926288 RepID=UPI002DDD448F|nr:alpha/beta hydrolase [Noviherbaspirillum sp.]HEV2610395.1 alpha/beta hydrolase [Noviherbaspirillum sp.]